MNTSIHEELKIIETETAHYAQAPHAFFQAWKQGVRLAGAGFFGDGTREGLANATDKWHLCPDIKLIKRAIGPMSSGEKPFLAAMVGFYNTSEGGALFKRIGVQGLSDLSGLDLQRKQIIAALLLNYTGW